MILGGNDNEKYKFAGKERDNETIGVGIEGYDYVEARDYDSFLGRWNTMDPLMEKYAGLSPYSYCLNNPLRFTDPTGMTVKGSSDEMDKKIQELLNDNEEFKKQYEILNNSPELYYVTYGDVTGKAEGDFSYDGSKFLITLESGGDISFSQKISHEFEHGIEYENGEMAFFSRDGKTWQAYNYDITDETKAWDAQLKTANAGDFFNNKGDRTSLWDYSRLTSQDKKESFLRARGYGNRSDGPFNNIFTQGELENIKRNNWSLKYKPWNSK